MYKNILWNHFASQKNMQNNFKVFCCLIKPSYNKARNQSMDAIVKPSKVTEFVFEKT